MIYGNNDSLRTEKRVKKVFQFGTSFFGVSRFNGTWNGGME